LAGSKQQAPCTAQLQAYNLDFRDTSSIPNFNRDVGLVRRGKKTENYYKYLDWESGLLPQVKEEFTHQLIFNTNGKL